MTERKPIPGLVAAKLASPRVEAAAVRPDTLAAFRRASVRRLTVVCAPAGYGKTTTTAAAADQLGLHPVWYKLDVLDHDPVVLLASLTEAFRQRHPSFGELILERLRSAADAPFPLEQMTAMFLSECDAHIHERFHVVLDDYHEAADSPELNRTLDYLLTNCPASLHFIVLSRYDPAFATAKMKLSGEIGLLGVDALRFDSEQAARVLTARTGAPVRPADVEHLVEATEGWPASIILAALSLEWLDLAPLESHLTDPRMRLDVYSYLAEQVYAREGPATQSFLKRTCCLEHITVELANLVVGIDDAQCHLSHLEAHRVFTFATPQEGAYRYHTLFRDYLRQRCLQEDGAQAFHDLQRDTSVALEDAGEVEMAIELSLNANEPQAALDSIARAGEPGLDNFRSESLISWLSRLDSRAGWNHPWVRLLRSQVRVRDGDYDAAIIDIDKAAHDFEAARDSAGLYHALSAKECALFWKGDISAAAETCRLALEHAPHDQQRVHTLISLGSAALEMRDWPRADEAYSEAERLLGMGGGSEKTRVTALRAFASFLQGDFRTAAQQITAAVVAPLRSSYRTAILNSASMIQMGLAEFDVSLCLAADALAVAKTYGCGHMEPLVLDNRGLCLASAGLMESALRDLQTAADTSVVRADSSMSALCLSHRGTVFRRLERNAECEHWYAAAHRLSLDGSDPYVRLNCSANLALIQCQMSETAESPLLDIAREAENALLLFVAQKARLFQARLLCLVGAYDAANELLASCVPAQLRLGHLNLLSQEMVLDPMLLQTYLNGSPSPSARDSLLRLVARHWRGPKSLATLAHTAATSLVDAVIDVVADVGQEDLLATILRSAEGNPDPEVRAAARRRQGRGSAVAENRLARASLTRRELEVLRLMSEGLRNPEIVRRLHLSSSTVKTHINHIFAKLGVEDRVAAVLEYQASIEG